MSDSSNPFGFGRLVPGFDFLQNLMEQAGKAGGRGGAAGLPGLSSWIAPTVNVEELDRRISELKAVSFWLDQNAKALSATVQALEVQKMTLATLAGMNVAFGDVAKAFQIKTPDAPAAPTGRNKRGDQAPANESWPHGADASAAGKPAGNPYEKSFQSPSPAPPEPPAEPAAPAADTAQVSAPPAGAAAGSVVDPMQWWGALTGQFQQIAANAMREAGSANPALAASREMAGAAMKNANRMAASMAGGARVAAKKTKAAARSTGPAKKTSMAASASRKTPTSKRTTGRS